MDFPKFLDEFDNCPLEDGASNEYDNLEQINFIIRSSRSSKRQPKASATGLTQAVVEVLKQYRRPMTVREIFEALEKNGYKWNFKFPLASLHNHLSRISSKISLSLGIIRVNDNKYTLAISLKIAHKE